MSKCVDEIFEKLDHEVTDMHFRWNMYCDVFAGGHEQTALLNRNGSNFFYYTQFMMMDHMALAFSKLTDPNTQGKNENLSLKQLHVVYSELGENELLQSLKEKFEFLKLGCEHFRELRNKRIAHGDFDHAMNLVEEPLPGISRAYVENALKLLREYMNVVNKHRSNSTTLYELTEGPIGASGKQLIRSLKVTEEAC